jgi:putative tryptophan/tyrosine transport system substrate-binding protein
VVAAPFVAEAQQGIKIARIGMLLPGFATDPSERYVGAFKQGLRDLGYTEGWNIAVDVRYAEGQQERLPGLVAELLRLKVDILVTGATRPTRAAKDATSTVPIVMADVGNPVAAGFVASLARPGGNITGVSSLSEELFLRRSALGSRALLCCWTRPIQRILSTSEEASLRPKHCGCHSEQPT